MKFKLNLNTIIRKIFSDKKSESTSNQVTKCSDLYVEYFNKYFITAIGSSDSILIHYWNSQKAEQSQSIVLRPVTDTEVLLHISTLKNRKSVGMDCIGMAVLKKASQIVTP